MVVSELMLSFAVVVGSGSAKTMVPDVIIPYLCSVTTTTQTANHRLGEDMHLKTHASITQHGYNEPAPGLHSDNRVQWGMRHAGGTLRARRRRAPRLFFALIALRDQPALHKHKTILLP